MEACGLGRRPKFAQIGAVIFDEGAFLLATDFNTPDTGDRFEYSVDVRDVDDKADFWQFD